MRKTILRTTLILAVLGLAALSVALLAGGGRSDTLNPRGPADEHQPQPEKPFQACPTPACMAPCIYGAPPQVVCQDADGSTAATTYFCCCCGGGGGANQYRPL